MAESLQSVLWRPFFEQPAGVIAALLFLICAATYYSSLHSFRGKMNRGNGVVPTAPYLVPLIGHTRIFARGGATLASALQKYTKPNIPVRFKGIGFDFALISGTHLVRKVRVSSSHLDFNKVSARMFGDIFGAPKAICDATLADDSGIGAKPLPGSSVHPGRRMLRNQALFFTDAFSKPSMDELLPIFINNLEQRCAALDIGNEWEEQPDLFTFIRKTLFPSGVDSFFGKDMLGINPTLEEDFWIYDNYIPFLGKGLPSWFNPKPERYRTKCLAAMKRWRQRVTELTNQNPVPDNAEWDPVWGLGAIRRRKKLFDASEGLFDEDAIAAVDLWTLWAFTANVIPATSWFLFEVLAADTLLDQARKTLQDAKTPDGTYDPSKVANQPLLQSIYAEVLRLHVSSLITRSVKRAHSLEGWWVPKDQFLFVSSHVEHRQSCWNAVDKHEKHHGPTDFWAERFLVEEDGETKFSMEDKQGQWIPYGMGEHMCPGRHLAKYQMLLSFAVLVTAFDIELLSPAGWRPDDDLARYGYGTQTPKQEVKFRIRRRNHKA